MRNIATQISENKLNIVGKLISSDVIDGVTSDGRKYKRARCVVRTTQTYNGREETSEVPVSMFAMQYTNANKSNPGYEQVIALSNMKTAQVHGFDNADVVRFSGANIRENNFVSRTSGQLVTGWQISASFAAKAESAKDTATFSVEIFIMDMHPEEDREGDTTGRLIVKGGVVQYRGVLDVVEFIVENRETADYIERNWNINDTVTVKGRIRVASEELKSSAHSKGGWGEDIPEMNTRTVRELIITTGDDEGKEEEFAFDPIDIKKAFAERRAKIEQMQIEARKGSGAKTENAKQYEWQ